MSRSFARRGDDLVINLSEAKGRKEGRKDERKEDWTQERRDRVGGILFGRKKE